jgi:hypothetical protein
MDHHARVEALRRRAAECETKAGETTSRQFRDCYRLLAKQYGTMARVEEDYAAGSERLAALGKPSRSIGVTGITVRG